MPSDRVPRVAAPEPTSSPRANEPGHVDQQRRPRQSRRHAGSHPQVEQVAGARRRVRRPAASQQRGHRVARRPSGDADERGQRGRATTLPTRRPGPRATWPSRSSVVGLDRQGAVRRVAAEEAGAEQQPGLAAAPESSPRRARTASRAPRANEPVTLTSERRRAGSVVPGVEPLADAVPRQRAGRAAGDDQPEQLHESIRPRRGRHQSAGRAAASRR